MPSSAPAADEENENIRKRPMDNEQPQAQPGPPGKKPRLLNGYENGFDATAMEIDEEQNGDENAYPSPEQLPSPVLATNGPEQGTQVDKVNDLSTEEVFLELSDEPTSKNTVVLQCEFSPRDPMILAAAGTDALARMWTISRVKPDSPSDSPGKPVFAPQANLLDDNAHPNTTVTCLSWSSDGLYIAVASEPTEGSAKIEFWNVDGSSLCSFNGFESPVICMRWNLANTECLALSPQDEGRGCLVSVMCPTEGKWAKFSLLKHVLLDQLLDATWISNEEFVICGGTLLQSFQYDGSSASIVEGRCLETRPGDSLSRITFDWHSGLIATASDSGLIDVGFLDRRVMKRY
jgi:transducin (beta)-like 1